MKKLLLSLIALATTVTMGFAQTNLVENGGFESWEENVPTNWKSSTKASSATLQQDKNAHSGEYAVLVKGASSGNKRLAYKEITLKAGTYDVTFFAKAATEEGGSVRPGYVPVLEDGSADSKGYVYGDYADNLTTASWTQVSYSFTLEAQTKVNLLVMNPKKPGKDVLIDDYSLTTKDGGLADGGTVDPTPDPDPTPTPEAEGIFSETFKDGQGDFTIDDKVLPEGLSYVWKADTKYGYIKASAYAQSQNHAAESWLVSPVIDLKGYKDCKLTFSHAANFFKDAETFNSLTAVKVRTEGGEWTNLAYEGEPKYTSWTFADASASLAAYDGQKIQIAFAYTSTTELAGSWEIKNFKVDGSKATGIAGITTDATAPAAIYSLDGRRLSAPVKGINIINGKKVLVK